MNLIAILPQLPWIKILIASAAYFIVGAIWYSPVLFSKWWIADNRFPKDFMKQKSNMAVVMLAAFLLTVLAVANLALLLGPAPNMPFALSAGALIGTGFMASTVGIGYLYTKKPLRLFAIDAGYHVVGMLLAAFLLAYLK